MESSEAQSEPSQSGEDCFVLFFFELSQFMISRPLNLIQSVRRG